MNIDLDNFERLMGIELLARSFNASLENPRSRMRTSRPRSAPLHDALPGPSRKR
jgi:hypothetical protein